MRTIFWCRCKGQHIIEHAQHAQLEQLLHFLKRRVISTFDWLLIMERSDFKNLTVESLAAYLSNSGVSDGAITSLRDQGVSGRALLLLDRQELKELLPKIGDLAIVRDVLGKIKDDASTASITSQVNCELLVLILHAAVSAHCSCIPYQLMVG